VEDLEGRIELVKDASKWGNAGYRRGAVADAPVVAKSDRQRAQVSPSRRAAVVKVEAQIYPIPKPGKEALPADVSDNCIGFDEKYVDRIFNVFQRCTPG